MSLFDYLAKNPEEASLFSESMAGVHSQELPAIVAAYDFSLSNTAKADLRLTRVVRTTSPVSIVEAAPV
jgi:hypothetical protein